MKMDCCRACGSLDKEKRVHLAAMDEFHEHFAREYQRLMLEYKRIEALLREVVWYNFETVARAWKHPWPESFGDSVLELHAHRYQTVPSRGGRHCEKATFPLYYEGPVRDAPPLPPNIVLHELKLAWDAVKRAEESCAAPYDWAPGGRYYEKMLRESDGVANYNRLSSDRDTESHGRVGLLLGDPMEREVSTDAETTAEDILGRVCGDRSLVYP